MTVFHLPKVRSVRPGAAHAHALVASCALAGVLLASAAGAGVSDPVPLIAGTDRARHVFSVTGVTANNEVGTVIICTSFEKTKDMRIAVEVFMEEPATVINDITTGSSNEGVPPILGPGATSTFEISRDGSVLFTGLSASVTPPSDRLHGSARVVATSAKLMCNAFLADDDGSPPSFLVELPMVAKTKQKGD